jgi:hypothetical protein
LNNNSNHIDTILKDKFQSFEGDIPMSDWLLIEEKLNKKSRPIWIWWAAIPLLIIAGWSFYLLNIEKSENTSPSISSIPTIQHKPFDSLIKKKESASGPIVNKEIEVKTKIQNSEHNFGAKSPSYIPGPIVTPFKQQIGLFENNLPEMGQYEFGIFVIKEPIFVWAIETPQVTYLPSIEFIRNNTKKSRPFSFEFGMSMAPAFGLDDLKANKSNFIHKSYFSSIANSSSLGGGANCGIHLQMNFGKHWFVRQGIYASNFSVSNNYNYTITEGPMVNKLGIYDYFKLDPDKVEHIQFSGLSSIKYLTMPMSIGNRTYFNTKFGLESKVGLNIARLLTASGKTVNPTDLGLESINSNHSIKKWNSGLSISSGVFYKPNNSFIFTVEPNFTTLLSSARNNTYPIKAKYYNFGLNFNLNYVIGGMKK